MADLELSDLEFGISDLEFDKSQKKDFKAEEQRSRGKMQ